MKKIIAYTGFLLAFFMPIFINISSNKLDNLLAQISAVCVIYFIVKITYYKESKRIAINLYTIIYMAVVTGFSFYIVYRFKPYFPINLFTIISIVFIGYSLLEYYLYINKQRKND